jgi:hypothetical protein
LFWPVPGRIFSAAMETTDKLLVACPVRGTANRVPRERLGAMDARSLSSWLARELGA